MLPVRGDLNDNEAFKAVMDEYPELSALAQWVPYSMPGLATDKDADSISRDSDGAVYERCCKC